LPVRPVRTDDWRIVSDPATGPDNVIFRVFLPEVVFDEKIFSVIREAFMNPHVGSVFHRDVIAPPLVRRFMNDDEVELKPYAAATRVALQVAVAKPVAIRD